MASDSGLSMEKCFRLVWTTEIPTEGTGGEECSSAFRIQDCLFHFEIASRCNQYEIRLVKENWRMQHEPFTITTVLDSETDDVHVETKLVTDGLQTFWSAPMSDVSLRYSDFSSVSVLRFKFIFDGDSGLEPLIESENDSVLSDSSLEKLSEDFGNLLDEDSSHDVELKCGNLTLNAHKSVLTARSKVFSAMLKSDMKEGRSGLVKIQDMDGKIMREFLRYLYTGKLHKLNFDKARRLYEAGDKYAVEDLKNRCSRFLSKNLKQDNACAVLTLADRHSDRDLKKDAIAYIVKEGIPLLDDIWLDFCRHHPQLANEVLNHAYKLNHSSQWCY